MAEHKSKKFRLSLVNAAEDVPRLVRAYGRACDGEFALVLRPAEERGLLVLVRKKEGALFWRSGDAPTDGRVRAKARIDGKRLRIEGGPHDGIAFHAMNAGEERALRGRDSELVDVVFHPDDQFASIVVPPAHTDAPAVPSTAITASDAVVMVKTEQKAVPKPGPITLRGQWSGWLHCDGGVPRVELVRKLAAYGVLRITSAPEGWTWSVERTEKWFSRPGVDTGTAATLVRAIEAGLARAMGLLGEACSVRDSRRRAALDTTYAAEHPIKPAHEGMDPTERFRPKKPRKPKVPAGSGWKHYADGDAPEADPIDRPSRAVLAKIKAGGLTHDAGAGTFLGRTVEVFDDFPVRSLVFRELDEGAGFYMHPPLEPRARTPRASPAPAASRTRHSALGDADKDKALLNAFSQAIAAAIR